MSIYSETTWPSKDGLQLYAQRWEVENKPRGVVCLVHGLGEHSSRYPHLAAFLNRAGYTLCTFDLRGHGKSAGQRGHAPSIDALMDDISLLLTDADLRFPGQRTFLYGHSLGGILVLNYGLRRKPKINGIIASAPALRSSIETQKAKMTLVKTVGSLAPTLTIPSGLESNAISRDPKVVEIYNKDPLVHDRGTLGLARSVLNSIPWLFAHAAEFPVPLLLMQGTADRIALPPGGQEFAQLVGDRCTLKLWEGLYHEIHNEPEQAAVFDYLLAWLEQH